MGILTHLLPYLRLLRARSHISYTIVVLGAVSSERGLSVGLAVSLLQLYVSFNVLLYGGIYTINALGDARSDGQHPSKRLRPIPSRAISWTAASAYAALLIAAAYATGALWFDGGILTWYTAFLCVNLIYTFIARDKAVFDVLANALPYPMRFLLGASLGDTGAPAVLPALVFLTAIGVGALRRVVERGATGWEARSSLKRYPRRTLLALRLLPAFGIAPLWMVNKSVPNWYFLTAALAYACIVFGSMRVRVLRAYLTRMWTS